MVDLYFTELYEKEQYAYKGTPLNSPERLEEFVNWSMKIADICFAYHAEGKPFDLYEIYEANLLPWLTMKELIKINDIRYELYEKDLQRVLGKYHQ